MDIKIPGEPIFPGSQPLVIIGPNGVGKTRLGVTITQNNAAERVAALRNVEIGEIPMQRFAQASQQVKRTLSDLLAHHWKQSLELQNLLSEILAEDRDCAVAYREHSERTPNTKLDEKLTLIFGTGIFQAVKSRSTTNQWSNESSTGKLSPIRLRR
jgi:ATPase subunit of ABC transporter with duplicated ATPase domains